MDASDYGQRTALLQTIKPHSSSALDESSLRPIAYCKRPNHYRRVLYLAIVEALNTFEELLLGKSNRVYTDHQLFQSIFEKDLALAPKCLQKMLLFLQRYNFTIVYRKGSLLNLADDLSRTHVKTKPSMSDTFPMFHVHLARLDPNPLALTNTTLELCFCSQKRVSISS